MQILAKTAIEWAVQQAAIIAARGTQLTEDELTLARRVGVAKPELIRIMQVPEVPMPDSPFLCQRVSQLGILGRGTIGLTIGYGIYIRNGELTPRVMSHEFRHVYQFEQAGSIAIFIRRYLDQMIEFGYCDAPFEVDARNFEIHL